MVRLTNLYTLYIHSNKPPTFPEGESPREKIPRGGASARGGSNTKQQALVLLLSASDMSYTLYIRC